MRERASLSFVRWVGEESYGAVGVSYGAVGVSYGTG